MTKDRAFAPMRAACAAALALALALPQAASAQDALLGELKSFGFDFCPRGWIRADGQLLPINQNQSLYSLLGTNFGGDGRTSFGVPDLRGRAPIGFGSGTGLSFVPFAGRGGAETVALTTSQLPPHSHSVMASPNTAASVTPTDGLFASPSSSDPSETLSPYTLVGSGVPMHPNSMGSTGNGQPHENRDPYLASTWCIATTGLFPSRN